MSNEAPPQTDKHVYFSETNGGVRLPIMPFGTR